MNAAAGKLVAVVLCLIASLAQAQQGCGAIAGCVASGVPTIGVNSGPVSSQGIVENSFSVFTRPTVKNNGGAIWVGTDWSNVGGSSADAYYTMFATNTVAKTGPNHWSFGWTSFFGLDDHSERGNQNVAVVIQSDKHGKKTNTFGTNIIVQDLAGGSDGSMVGVELDINGRSSTAFPANGLMIFANSKDGGTFAAKDALTITVGDGPAFWRHGIKADKNFDNAFIDTSAATITNKLAMRIGAGQKIELHPRAQLWLKPEIMRLVLTIDGTDYNIGPP